LEFLRSRQQKMNDDQTHQKNDDLGEDPSRPGYNVREKINRRSGIDRRCFSYVGYLPERRSGEERRGNPDRREI
jgi:hypothetical protein